MWRKIINATLFIPLLVIFSGDAVHPSISEGELAHYSNAILARIVSDNPESGSKIRQCLSGLLKDKASGIRLMDKLGIFLYDSSRRGIMVEKTSFYCKNNLFSLHLVMRDKKDSQQYTLFLEYDYLTGGRCVLRDVYFSLVFDERQKEIKRFFGNR
ncbi:MAG: hypothetical protein JXA20_10340 [Spirochaetes bacterium]|nr:hypothetical protein [Spirochaetota bacterium]